MGAHLRAVSDRPSYPHRNYAIGGRKRLEGMGLKVLVLCGFEGD